MRRSYSICSGPAEGELRIGVKRVENGVFSSFANELLSAGHVIDVMTPTGRFGQIHRAGEARTYAGFAAGSGITPILSILRGILKREPGSRFFLFYGNRSMTDMLFRPALEELKDRFLDRLAVFHVLSQEEQDVPVLNGRLDVAKTRLLLTHIAPAAFLDDIFICGPTGMSEAVETACRELGLAQERIHVERFVSEFGGRARPKAPPPLTPDAPARTAVLIVDGKRREVGGARRRGGSRRRAPGRPRSSLRLQGRHVLDLPGEGRRGRGGDGPELLARAVGVAGRLRPHLPVPPQDKPGRHRLRPGLGAAENRPQRPAPEE